MTTNPQVQRTKKWLFDSLMDLMKTKPFRKITVQDIVRGAGLSRSAFYSHYTSKEDILREKVQEYQNEYVDLSLSSPQQSQFENWKKTVVAYQKHSDFYIQMYRNDLVALISNAEFENYSGTISLVSQTLGDKSPEDPDLYYGAYMHYHRPAQIKLILEWLDDGCKTSVDEITALVASIACINVYNEFRKDYLHNLSLLSSQEVIAAQ